ncbi:MAG: hypothetical protein RR536_01715 [Anaerovoracaceae bacterium]
MINGVCNFCGQLLLVEADTQKDADWKATNICDCGQSKHQTEINKLEIKLNNLIGKNAESNGVFTEVEKNVYKYIFDAAMLVLNKDIEQAQFKVDGTTVTITAKGDKGASINRTKKTTCKEEF